jgi:hypothetical protein
MRVKLVLSTLARLKAVKLWEMYEHLNLAEEMFGNLRLAKELDEHLKEARRLRDLDGAIDRVMRELDPYANPDSIRPRRPRQPNAFCSFSYGELIQRIYDVLDELPEGDAVSARAIAEKPFRDKGFDPQADRALWDSVMRRFLAQLRKLQYRNKIERLGQFRGATWRLRSKAAPD